MKRTNKDFNFLCGILRSREYQLLPPQKLETLLGLNDYKAVFNQLPELPFSTELHRQPGMEGIEAGFRAELAELKELLAKFSPSEEFSRLVFLPWDFFNLKSAVLQKLRAREAEEFFGPEGEVGIKELKAMAAAMEFTSLPKHLFEALQRAWIAYYEEEKDTQSFEIALDREKQRAVGEAARELSGDLYRYWQRLAAVKLAEVFLRAYFAQIPWRTVRWGFSGYRDIDKLKSFYTLKPQEWESRIPALSQQPLQRILLAVREGEDMEKAIAEESRSCASSIQDWRYRPPSLEYAYYFLMRKLADLYNLRLILICKANRIAEQEIRKRVRDAFV